tara:strand:+ start:349 stop:510 length:162 start_codon:yes stop_codon:yes gene_type:complete
MYKLFRDLITNETNIIIKINGNERTYIPFNEENSDYQEYLKWVAEGNKIEDAD